MEGCSAIKCDICLTNPKVWLLRKPAVHEATLEYLTVKQELKLIVISRVCIVVVALLGRLLRVDLITCL